VEKLKILKTIMVGILATNTVFAAFEDKPTSARITSLGGAGTAVIDNSSEIFYNPAAIGLINGLELSAMDLKLYRMDELGYNYFDIALPVVKPVKVSLSYQRFGPINYKENIYTFGLGLGEKQLFAGLLFNLMNLEITDGGASSVLGIDAGMLYRINNKISLGLSAKNVNGPTFGSYREKIEQKYQLGLGWRFSDYSLTSLDLLNYSDDPNLYVSLGEELSYGWVSFRAGVRFNPAIYSLGIGFGPKWLKIDYAYQTHSYLLSENQFSVVAKIPLTFRRERPSEEEGVIKTEVTPAEEIPALEKETGVGEITGEKVNINTASEKELMAAGFSEEAAKNIVRFRQRQGEFKAIEDIINIPGVFFDTLDKVRDKITAEPSVKENPQVLPELEKAPQKIVPVEEKTKEIKTEMEVKKSTETKKAVEKKVPKKRSAK